MWQHHNKQCKYVVNRQIQNNKGKIGNEKKRKSYLSQFRILFDLIFRIFDTKEDVSELHLV